MIDIALNIKWLAKNRNLTNTEIAKQIGISREQFQNRLRKNNFKISEINELAKVFDVPPESLCGAPNMHYFEFDLIEAFQWADYLWHCGTIKENPILTMLNATIQHIISDKDKFNISDYVTRMIKNLLDPEECEKNKDMIERYNREIIECIETLVPHGYKEGSVSALKKLFYLDLKEISYPSFTNDYLENCLIDSDNAFAYINIIQVAGFDISREMKEMKRDLFAVVEDNAFVNWMAGKFEALKTPGNPYPPISDDLYSLKYIFNEYIDTRVQMGKQDYINRYIPKH